ncbi:MAG TPA: nuclear transport factor 2 family protein [Solirubrobacterales bacterium]|nr:nuclear transport factor 2 family protein [Solirubrobacterales bacterium]
MSFDPDIEPRLSRLVAAYAAAVDARDLEALRRLFLSEATLTVRRGGGEPRVFRGHAGLAGVIEALAPFELTLHEVSAPVFEPAPGGEEATGACVCVAHHVRRGESSEADDLVLHGRYSDRFRRDADDTWRFAARELRVLWTEKRSVRIGD